MMNIKEEKGSLSFSYILSKISDPRHVSCSNAFIF
jgi:hypothetical protein